MNHTTRDGQIIPIREMSDSHLANVIRLLRRQAHDGMVIRRGGMDVDDPWYDEDHFFGDDALVECNYIAYADEALRRGLTISMEVEK